MVDESPYFLPKAYILTVITEIFTISTNIVPNKLQKLHLTKTVNQKTAKKGRFCTKKGREKNTFFSPFKISSKLMITSHFLFFDLCMVLVQGSWIQGPNSLTNGLTNDPISLTIGYWRILLLALTGIAALSRYDWRRQICWSSQTVHVSRNWNRK